MKVTDAQINSIVDRVVDKIAPAAAQPEAKRPAFTPPKPQTTSVGTGYALGVFSTIEEAIDAAEVAYWQYKKTPVNQRKRIIEAIRQICRDNLEELARRGVEETGMGRYADKLVKNSVCIEKTPGVEDLGPTTHTGDEGLTLIERAPFGVIGSITPCTNPTETIICNGIGMIASGNTVAFNTHPSAMKTSIFVIDLLNKAAISEGAPPNLFTTVAKPTIASANILMKHPKIGLLVVTGGPAVVAAAMKSGKRVVGAGPGNPPVVVDETADPDKAAKDIVKSASMDNNIICVIEKEIIVLREAADALRDALVRHGSVLLSPYQAKQLENVIVKDGIANKDFIGKDIQVILKEIGLNVDSSKRMAIVETDKNHPFARLELLMPVLPFIRVNSFEEAIDTAYELEDGCFHTSVIHSKNIDRMHQMHIKMNTTIFVKNGPALAGLGAGGEGPASFTIASPTGEGVTTARHFCRSRRCVLSEHFGIV